MTTGIFFCSGDMFGQAFHFIVDGIHSMTIGFYLFILALAVCINQVLYIAKIKMTQQQYFSSI